jgi:tetratricopeptide (TPR) repeat protein
MSTVLIMRKPAAAFTVMGATAASIALVLLASFPGPVVAQGRNPPVQSAPVPHSVPGAAQPFDPLKVPVPQKASERKKLLDTLFAYLAAAGSEGEAQPIAGAIERLWMLNGSDTTAYLMDRAAKAVGDRNLDLALRFMTEVTELAPDYAEGWNRRAYVFFLMGETDRALGDLRRCLALEPMHYRALEALAVIFKNSGQKAAALKAYERLNEIHPNLPGVQEGLKDMTRAVDGQRT